jgi:tetratricopeptide (TPR) repeat protein
MSQTDPAILGRRYVLLHPLNSGGMGSVYRALDRLTGQHVALKRVLVDGPAHDNEHTTTSIDSRLALAGEFRLLASLRHPNLISVLDYGFDNAGLPFYTMDLLDDAQTILEAGQQAGSFEAQVALILQLLQALAYMHQRGVIHRDLKPQNILVTNGDVRVLDFGLSTMLEQASIGGTTGTLAYMAPEVLRGEDPTFSVDLYAVGLIAYEIFTGQHPFANGEMNSTIRNILHAQPDLMTTGMNLRAAVILDQLLAKHPAERQPSATVLINEFSRLLGPHSPIETTAIRESFLQAAKLVGRSEEMSLLSTALSAAIRGNGAAWLLGGESGVGKSRLIDEIATLALVQGALVLRGQAVETGASPFQLWRGPLRWLGLLSEPEQADLAQIARLLPEVAAARGIQPADNTPSGNRQLSQVVARVLSAQPQPVVLILEDLQWAGSESLSLLQQIVKTISSLPLLIIASYRDDERADLPTLLRPMHLLKLSRLMPNHIAELSEAMLGADGRAPAVLQFLSQETEGNVFFLIEVVRALAEEAGRLDRVTSMALPQHVFTGGVERIIQRRLDAVPSDSRELLNLAAIAGRELNPTLLARLDPTIRIDRWLSHCIDAAVIEFRDGQLRFSHDKLRHGLMSRLADGDRKRLHSTVAAEMEILYEGKSGHYAALSYHWGEAGETTKEAQYAGLAGHEALRSSAYREAIQFVRRALALPIQHDEGTQTSLYRTLGEAQAALGQYEEATETFNIALECAQKSGEGNHEASIRYALGDVAYALEAFEQAEAHYKASLEQCQVLGDAPGIMRALSSLGNVAYDLDDYDKANEYYKQSLALSRELGSRWGMAGSFGASTSDHSN